MIWDENEEEEKEGAQETREREKRWKLMMVVMVKEKRMGEEEVRARVERGSCVRQRIFETVKVG